MNQQMMEVMALLKGEDVPLPEELNKLLKAGIEERFGALIFRSFYTEIVNEVLKIRGYYDLAGYELTQNRIHFEDYCAQECVLSVAFDFLNLFTQLHSAAFDKKPVLAVLSCRLDSEFGTVANFTFYGDRNGQSVIDMESLDKYSEGLLVRRLGGERGLDAGQEPDGGAGQGNHQHGDLRRKPGAQPRATTTWGDQRRRN